MDLIEAPDDGSDRLIFPLNVRTTTRLNWYESPSLRLPISFFQTVSVAEPGFRDTVVEYPIIEQQFHLLWRCKDCYVRITLYSVGHWKSWCLISEFKKQLIGADGVREKLTFYCIYLWLLVMFTCCCKTFTSLRPMMLSFQLLSCLYMSLVLWQIFIIIMMGNELIYFGYTAPTAFVSISFQCLARVSIQEADVGPFFQLANETFCFSLQCSDLVWVYRSNLVCYTGWYLY